MKKDIKIEEEINIIHRRRKVRLIVAAVIGLLVVAGIFAIFFPQSNFSKRRDISRAIKSMQKKPNHEFMGALEISKLKFSEQLSGTRSNNSYQIKIVRQYGDRDVNKANLEKLENNLTINGSLVKEAKGETSFFASLDVIGKTILEDAPRGKYERENLKSTNSNVDTAGFAKAMGVILSPSQVLQASLKGQYGGKTKDDNQVLRWYKVTDVSRNFKNQLSLALKILSSDFVDGATFDSYIIKLDKEDLAKELEITMKLAKKEKYTISLRFENYAK